MLLIKGSIFLLLPLMWNTNDSLALYSLILAMCEEISEYFVN